MNEWIRSRGSEVLEESSPEEQARLCAVPEDCPRLDKFDVTQFSAFGTHFLSWINTVEKVKLGILSPADAILSSSNELPAGLEGLIVMNKGEEEPRVVVAEKGKKGKGKAKAKTKAGGKKNVKKTQETEDDGDFDCEKAEEINELDEEDEKVDGEKVDGEEDVEEEQRSKRSGVPLSAYELQREKNIERNRELMKQIGLKDAMDDLAKDFSHSNAAKTAVTAKPRPKPKAVTLSTRVTRSSASAASNPTPEGPSAAGPLADVSPKIAESGIATAGGQVIDPADENVMEVDSPFPAGPPPSKSAPSQPPASESATSQPLASKSAPSRPPSSFSLTRTKLVEAFEGYEVEFDLVLDKVDPAAYADVEGKSKISEHGQFLLDVPEDSVAKKPRPPVYEALVCKWMELELVLQTMKVPDVRLDNGCRPIGFKPWFKDGRITRAAGFRTPSSVTLPDIRTTWWKYFDDNMPEWRTRIDGKVVPGGEGNWEDCELPGPDGIVLFLVTLK
ncbi:hypothetical protein V5O48_018601 [Marasmius crinis-equi]|uniref:Uncharacterized protein n=1 Tax=Marasmius crinis-equi TaxID=585013 RepID=A0ABR3EKQ2_9AGAR